MMQKELTPSARQQAAHDRWVALPHGGRDTIRLRVHCDRSHHVASVYETDEGLVVVTPVRARSHGSRDRADEPHGGHGITMWVDYLRPEDPQADDVVPAWCDCGHRTLSRSDLLSWIAAGEQRVVVD